MLSSYLKAAVCTLTIGAFLSVALPAQAANPKPKIKDPGYAVRYVGQSLPDPLTLEAGEQKTVVFKFKNVGTETLKAKGTGYATAFTMEERYRASAFEGPTWESSSETAPLSKDCAPGDVCELPLQLVAPETPGEYKEEFHLASKWYTWIKGGYFWTDIVVVPKPVVEEPAADVPAVSTTTEEGVETTRAKILARSKKSLSGKGGDAVSFVIVYKNDGEEDWDGYALEVAEPIQLAGESRRLTFADRTWKSETQAAVAKGVVKPGDTTRQKFTLRLPFTAGSYDFSLAAYSDGKMIPGSEMSIPVTVTSDAPAHVQAPVFSNSLPAVEPEKPRLDHEPRIRVGVWKVDEKAVVLQPVDDDYNVFIGGSLLGVLPKGKSATLRYSEGEYQISSSLGLQGKDDGYIRIEPRNNPRARFRILNHDRLYQRRVYNEYRGSAEYRKVQGDDQLYVINDLLMSDYVAGIGENSNVAPMEYLKAQTVAQRTYAYFIKEYSDKHEKRHFDVVAHTGDQLYLGYKSELERPNFVRAAKATRGYMVTYDTDENPKTLSDIVITPYFAYTNGRTRSWKEVWGGAERPWLVSVKAVYDKKGGRRLFGHGVGMSQLDAAERAEELGEDWKTLLKYYYTGVEVEKIF